MFRIWGKIFKDNHLLQDMVYENNDPDLNRTRKVYARSTRILHGI